MVFIGSAIVVIAVAILLVADIMIIIQAFKTSIPWGLGTLFIPIISILFIIYHWDKTKKYALWFLISILLSIVGGTIANLG